MMHEYAYIDTEANYKGKAQILNYSMMFPNIFVEHNSQQEVYMPISSN